MKVTLMMVRFNKYSIKIDRFRKRSLKKHTSEKVLFLGTFIYGDACHLKSLLKSVLTCQNAQQYSKSYVVDRLHIQGHVGE